MEPGVERALQEATVQATLPEENSRVFLEYRGESGGPALAISLGTDLFRHLIIHFSGKDKARQWLEARVGEVADLSVETVEHYLNFVIKQQVSAVPKEYSDSERLTVLPLCLLPSGSRTSFCASCSMCPRQSTDYSPDTQRKAG